MFYSLRLLTSQFFYRSIASNLVDFSDTLEIRYYGYWAKTIDDLRGISISDTPVHNYASGQKVLLILDHEEDTAVMGGGYYPLFEGSFVIDDDVAISQTGEQTTIHQLNAVINRVVNDEIVELDCFLTEYWDGTKCMEVDFDTDIEPEQFQPHPGLGMLNQAERKCETIGGTWNVEHCIVTQEIIDSNKLTCDPGPVLESGTCQSNGVKLVFESAIEPKPEPDFLGNNDENIIPSAGYSYDGIVFSIILTCVGISFIIVMIYWWKRK